MTENACQFITPMTFETLTAQKVYTDTFDRNFEFKVDHIELGKWADDILIAPATANVIGKLANGIADEYADYYGFSNEMPYSGFTCYEYHHV